MRKVKLFIIYFPVLLIAGQVICNLLYFISKTLYYDFGFYFSLIFGTNLFFALFLVAFTHMFRFCEVSKWAAYAELAFGINYLIVQKDNLYNILFQVIVGLIAIMITFRHIIKKFPLCRLSLLREFMRSLWATNCKCDAAIDHWKGYVIKHYDPTKN